MPQDTAQGGISEGSATNVLSSTLSTATSVLDAENPSDSSGNADSTQTNYPLNHTESFSADELSGLGVVGSDPFGLTKHPLLAFLLIFLAGLGLAFTPCILPMLPIVANIVAGQDKPSTKRSFMLSSSYGLGVSTAYGILGGLIAYLGGSIGLLGLLQNPVIVLSFAIIFVLLGLYMLEVINIRLPNAISQPLHRLSEAGNHKLGSVSGSFMVGLLSALVVSPCVSAPLSGVLVAVSSIGNIALGFIALFCLGLGLSIPLVLFATTEGKLLPQAGEWMNKVKQGFAYLMFAVALMMAERVFKHPVMLLVWAGWFVTIAVWAWRSSSHISKNLPKFITRLVAVLAMVWAGCLAYGALINQATDSLQPFSKQNAVNAVNKVVENGNASDDNATQHQPVTTQVTQEKKQTQHITNLDELDKILQNTDNVVVDLVADWCIECRIMEKELFVSPPAQLSGWQVVKLDITETDDKSKAVLARYELVGPPTLLYYQQGQLLTKQVGQVSRDNFEQLLEKLNESRD